MSELNEHAILYNTAALTSLKRAQLVSLSKRYGLKANGKNNEIVQRLQDFGQSLTPCAKNMFDAALAQDSESPTKQIHDNDEESESLAPLPVIPIKALPSSRSIGRTSEAWEVITPGDSSLVEEGAEVDAVPEPEPEPEAEQNSVSTRSWKSADNGAPLDDFGNHKHHELRGVGSLRSLASSIRRTASRTLGTRSKDAQANQAPLSSGGEDAHEPEFPPSPASTIGVTKRHQDALHHRSSTIRLVSPSAAEAIAAVQRAASPEYDEELPLMGQNTVELIRQRTSKPPARGSCPPVSLHNQRSLPLLQYGSRGIYPSLPTVEVTHSDTEALALNSPEMPGSFPGSPASPSFVFGTSHQVSNAEFSDVGARLLQEMQSKLAGSGSSFNAELLKGKDAELTKLVNVNPELGTGSGGWGLSAGSSTKDRYAERHEREFSRMTSLQSSTDAKQIASAAGKRKLDSAALSSTADGLPLPTVQDEATERGNKRPKTAVPIPRPRYFSSLRKSVKSPVKAASTPTPSFMQSVRGGHSTGKFGFLRHKRTASKSSPDSVTSDGEYVLPAASVPVDGAPLVVQKKTATGAQSVRQSTLHQPTAASMSKATRAPGASLRRGPIPDFNPAKPTFEPLKDHSSEAASAEGSAASKTSIKSTSQRPLSAASSMSTLSRSTGKHNLSRIASTEFDGSVSRSPSGLPVPTTALPKSNSRVGVRPLSVSSRATSIPRGGSTLASSKSSSRASTISRSGSTLLAPTAASRARMQATIKPPEQPVKRPLPQPPTSGLAGIQTMSPFGEASSRANHLFESNFHLEPVKSPFASPRKSVASPAKRSLPHTPSAARRARASGVTALKSSAHHDNADVNRRRSEFRAKHARLTQERELRRMLG